MAEKMTSLDTAKRLIEEYSIREFGEMEIDFSDLSKIPVAATTFDEGQPGEYEVSVFLDLVSCITKKNITLWKRWLNWYLKGWNLTTLSPWTGRMTKRKRQ